MDRLTESAHPSVEILRSFGLGQLGEAEASAVEDHVSNCEACCRTLAQAGADTFTDLLRSGRQKPASEAVTLAPGLPRPLAEGGQTAAESSAGSAPDGPPPALVGHPRYRVLGLLGAGGMGSVYKAEHRLMERAVALKVMTRAVVASEATVDRFRREVKAAARLSHPNIVAAYDAEQAGDAHFLVMEYVEGTDLARWLAQRGPLPVAEACDYVRQAALGLQHAHEHGMIHRDIKPHNLMRTPGGTVKILDFGLARLAAEAGGAASGLTGQGILLGTVDYLAPEQADDARRADIRSDIYSLGCTLYQLLSGRLPFPKGSVVQKLMAHVEREPRSLQKLRPDLPPGLVAVVQRMMAKSPDDRYQTPEEVWEALAPFAGQTVVIDPAPRQTKKAGKASGAVPRRRWLIAAGASLLAFVGIVAGTAVYRIQTDKGELLITTDDPDVEVVVKQNGKRVRIIDTKTNKEVRLDSGSYDLELGGKAGGLTLTPDKVTINRNGQAIATVERRPAKAPNKADSDGTKSQPAPPALLFSVPFQLPEYGVQANVFQTGVSADGRLFFASGDTGASGRVRVCEVATGKPVRDVIPGGDVWYSFARFLPDSQHLVTSYNKDKDLYLWDVATGKPVRKFVGHTETDLQFAVSPDGKRLVSWSIAGTEEKVLRLWDVESGQELRQLKGHTDKAAGVFSPDGKQVLTYSRDKTLRLWDAGSGKELKKLEGHSDACTGCFSPDGKQALSYGPDGTIRLWDLEAAKEIRRFEGPTNKVSFAGFVAEGRFVVGRSDDRKFRVWETAGGKLRNEIDLSQFDGVDGSITATPDGRQALVRAGEDSVRVLDLLSGKETLRYDRCHAPRVFSFSPDGTVAVAGSFRAGLYGFRLPAPPAK